MYIGTKLKSLTEQSSYIPALQDATATLLHIATSCSLSSSSDATATDIRQCEYKSPSQSPPFPLSLVVLLFSCLSPYSQRTMIFSINNSVLLSRLLLKRHTKKNHSISKSSKFRKVSNHKHLFSEKFNI